MVVQVHETDKKLNVAATKSDSSSGWVERYADSRFKLGFWKSEQTWWHVTGDVDGIKRDWKLLPVYHPAANSNYDSEYKGTIKVLAKIRKSPHGEGER